MMTCSLLCKQTLRFSAVLIFIFSFSISLSAQTKETAFVNQVWVAYNNQTRFSKHWGSWTDLHLRTKEKFFTNFSQSIIRLGLTYYIRDNTRLTAGYAYVNHFPADNHPTVSQPEHRPWQQISWVTRYSRIRTIQWVRLEERFRRKIATDGTLADGYLFNYRIRYNLLVQFPLSKNAFTAKSWAFVVNDEIHVNFGKEILYNYYDQNRLFVGFSFMTNKTDNIQFGYMNLFQQLSTGYKFRMINVPRISYFHHLDLRKK